MKFLQNSCQHAISNCYLLGFQSFQAHRPHNTKATAERRKEMAASGENRGGTFMMAGAGGQRDFARQMAPHRSSQQGDFGPSIDHAVELCREDTDPSGPNQAPKAF